MSKKAESPEVIERYAQYGQMVADLAKPGEDIIATLTPLKMHMVHMGYALQGEVFELSEIKDKDYEDLLTEEENADPELAKARMIELIGKDTREELGDALFYFTGMLDYKEEWTLHQFVANAVAILATEEGNDTLSLLSATERLCNAVKKLTIYNKPITDDELEAALQKFINTFVYVATIYQQKFPEMNVNLRSVMAANQDKLLTGKNARYASGSYSDEQAQTRADKAGTDEE